MDTVYVDPDVRRPTAMMDFMADAKDPQATRRELHRENQPLMTRKDAWERLRGALKDVYAEFGGGEVYLRKERARFDSRWEDE